MASAIPPAQGGTSVEIKIAKSDGSLQSVGSFPLSTLGEGTYNLSFQKEDGTILNAGNIYVDGEENTYELKFGLTNGDSISAGTFTTWAPKRPTKLVVNNNTGADAVGNLSFTLEQSNNPLAVKLNGSQIYECSYNSSDSNVHSFLITMPAGQNELVFDGGRFYFDGYIFATERTIKNANINSIEFGSNYGTIIGDNAFRGSSISSIVVPKRVSSIRTQSFAECKNLKSFVFASGSNISHFAKEVFILETNTESSTTGNLVCNELNGLKYIGSKDNPYMLCAGAVDKNITSVDISADCVILGCAFLKGCANVTSVFIPKGIKIITEHSFASCTNLSSIVFEEGSNLKWITGYHHMYMCENLQTVAFPDSLEQIFDYRTSVITFANTGPSNIYFGPNSNLKLLKGGSLFAKDGITVHFGKKLEVAEKIFSTFSCTYNVYFCHGEDDPVLFDPTKILGAGSSKYTVNYNVYTDNSIIKDGVLSKVDEYTIINVYHYDGTVWE